MKIEDYKKIMTKRNKFGAVKTEHNGIKFDSLMECEMYKILCLKQDVVHVDCHVPVTLVGGLRLNIDFFVYDKNGKIKAYECKGKETNEFKRMRKLFDATHPLAPLEVWRRIGKKWHEI